MRAHRHGCKLRLTGHSAYGALHIGRLTTCAGTLWSWKDVALAGGPHVAHAHLHNEVCCHFLGPLSRLGLLLVYPFLLSIGIGMDPSPHLIGFKDQGTHKQGKWWGRFVLRRLPSPQGSSRLTSRALADTNSHSLWKCSQAPRQHPQGLPREHTEHPSLT